jgi:hypothetical protein
MMAALHAGIASEWCAAKHLRSRVHMSVLLFRQPPSHRFVTFPRVADAMSFQSVPELVIVRYLSMETPQSN